MPVQRHLVDHGDVVREVFGRATIESHREVQLGFDLVGRVSGVLFASVAQCDSCKAALCPPDRPLSVPSETDFDELIRDPPVAVLVDF